MKKVQSRLTNVLIHDLGTFNTDRAVPYSICISKLNKNSGKYIQDITHREYEKSRIDFMLFNGNICINELLDYVLEFEGEARRVENEFVKYKFYLKAHNGSGFDSYVVLNSLLQWRTVVNLIKNGAGFVFTKNIQRYIDENKKLLNIFILDVEDSLSKNC